jgi:Ras family protein
MLVYNIGSRMSFDILKAVNEKLLNLTGTAVPRILIGNVADLEEQGLR